MGAEVSLDEGNQELADSEEEPNQLGDLMDGKSCSRNFFTGSMSITTGPTRSTWTDTMSATSTKMTKTLCLAIHDTRWDELKGLMRLGVLRGK